MFGFRLKRRTEVAPEATGEEAPGPRTSGDISSAGWWSRPGGQRFLLLLVCALALAALVMAIRPPASLFVLALQEGELSDRVVDAPLDFEYVDPLETEKARELAAAKEPPVFEAHPEVPALAAQQLEILRTRLLELDESDTTGVEGILAELSIELEDVPHHLSPVDDPNSLPLTYHQSLLRLRSTDVFWDALDKVIGEFGARGIVLDSGPVIEANENARQLLSKPTFNLGFSVINLETRVIQKQLNVTGLLDFATLQTETDESLKNLLPDSGVEPGPVARELGIELISALIGEPSLRYLAAETERRRQKARDTVVEVKHFVDRYHTIVGKGQAVDREAALMLSALQQQYKLTWGAEVGFAILVLLPLLGMLSYIRRYHPSVFASPRQLAVLLGLLILIVAMGRAAGYLSRLNPNFDELGFAVPLGALGLAVTILISGRLAVIFVATASLYLSGLLDTGSERFSFECATILFWTGLVSILSVPRVKRRADLYRAGLAVAVTGWLFVIAFRLAHTDITREVADWEGFRQAMIWVTLNGALSSILSIALLPILEDMLGVITDIKLLELGRKTRLLQRLEREAPGSYQHTMAVATLAESAAEAIGADSLLTRVGAYYHDIGKMLKPQYFTENQESAADRARHAKLKPQMSVLVIRNHVKHGMELAREHGLPKVIADFIPQHHGTMLMKYFYHRILEDEPEEQVREENFRYPGPKPQRKETAIVMLADAMEAAARVLEDKSEVGIRQFVDKMFQERLEDGQFDECDLALSELSALKESFRDTLHHMMHQRITYPSRPAPVRAQETGEDVEKRRTAEAAKVVEGARE